MRTKSDQLKFLFVIDNLSTGGAQRQMINLALGLTNRGYLVEIFCYTPGDLLIKPLMDAGIPIHWYLKTSRFSTNIILDLRKIISRGKIDLVLSFLTTPNFYSIVATRSLFLNRIPVIVSERFCDLPQGVSRIEKFARQFYRAATHVVTNSFHQRDNLKTIYPWLKNRISTIYNGYDLQKFSPGDRIPNNDPIQILAIASVSPYKNGLCLVEALSILRKRDNITPQVDWIGQLVLMGERLDYLNQMNEALNKYDLTLQWKWLNQRTDIVEQLQSHDLLVHPSFGEGLPNVVCEALACGRPVILSETLDHKNLVQDGISGFLFDHTNPNDLADKIKKFISLSIDQKKEMGINGRKFTETHLSQERLVNDYEKLFLEVLN